MIYSDFQGKKLSMLGFGAMRLPSMWLIHLRSTVDFGVPEGSALTEAQQKIAEQYNIAPLFYRLLGFSLLFALIGSVIFQLGLYEKSKVRKDPPELETLRISPSANTPAGEQ